MKNPTHTTDIVESFLKEDSEQTLKDSLKDDRGTIATNYFFTDFTTGEQTRLEIPTGAITIIGGQTGHGKSTLLENLALQMATNQEEGSVLFFSFEEDKASVLLKFLNLFCNVEISKNNRKAIRTYLRSGEDVYRDLIKGEGNGNKYLIKREGGGNKYLAGFETFKTREKEFYKLIGNNLKVYNEPMMTGDDIVATLDRLRERIKIKAVFLDYIQLIRTDATCGTKKDMLESLCLMFKDFANKTHLPIIMASQLNREVSTLASLVPQKIADASNIEHVADTILLIWNSAKESIATTTRGENKELVAQLNAQGFFMGRDGKLAIKLAKSRQTKSGLWAVCDFNGNTGTINQR